MGEGVLTGGHAYHRPQWQATNGPARHAGEHNSGISMARTRRPLIAGNWKMNGLRADGLALAKGVADGVKQAGWNDRDVLVCPPATLVLAVADAVKGSGVQVGGENCHAKPSGAHTGEVAAEMLRDCGATYVIVGHSERRADCGETDAIVRAKAEAAWRAGLVPIVCSAALTAGPRRALAVFSQVVW